MRRSTLARYRLTGGGRFSRTSPEGGGGQPGGEPGGQPPAGQPGQGQPGEPGGQPGSQPGGQPPTDPNDPNYFPPNTPVVEMTAPQQAAYWRNQSKVQQQRAERVRDYDEVAEKARQWDELQRQNMTPSQQAIEEAKAAGRAEALQSANGEQVQNLLRVALAAKGKSGDDLDELVAAANPAAFIADGKVVADRVTSYAARIAGGSAGGGGRPDLGQGRRESNTKPSVASGRDLYQERHQKKDAAAATT